jgi:hypothetical protein
MFKLILTLAASLAFAHPGHDHNAPGSIEAPKGGLLKSLEKTHVEVVNKGKDVKIYLYDMTMKPRDVAKFQVTATTELPRAKKPEDLPLTKGEGFYAGTYDSKGAHRFTLRLKIKDPETGHDDRMEFVLEPRK